MSTAPGLHSLATIIKRLEATASRFEDLAEIQASLVSSRAPAPLASGANASNTASAAPPAPPAPPPAPKAEPAPVVEDPAIVKAFDETVSPDLTAFVKLSNDLNPLVKQQVSHVSTLFDLTRNLVHRASASKKPDDASFQTILAPFVQELGKISELKDSNRSNREFFNHLSTIAEGIPAVAWVTISPKPGPYITEMKNAAQFYSLRIVKEYKEKDKKHVEWTRAFETLLDTLKKYVMQHHTTGLSWNASGGDAAKWSSPSSGATKASSAPPGPPPPAPPPPPPGTDFSAKPTPAAPSGGTAAVFADINKGADVTKGLRKVPKEEMTHKNPSLRSGGSVPDRSPSPVPGKKPVRPAKPAALAGKKPSSLELKGNQWIAEFFENEKSLVVDQCAINQSVSLYGCKNTTVIIKGKVNAVTISNCNKTQVLVDSVIASINVTSSPSFVLQVTGKAPIIQLDKNDSGQIYLSRETIDIVEIVSAQCSAINVSLPVEGEEDGVFVEKAVPEMFKTVVRNGQLVTTLAEITA